MVWPIRRRIYWGYLHLSSYFPAVSSDGEIRLLGDVTALAEVFFYSLAARAILMIAISQWHVVLRWVELLEVRQISPIP